MRKRHISRRQNSLRPTSHNCGALPHSARKPSCSVCEARASSRPMLPFRVATQSSSSCFRLLSRARTNNLRPASSPGSPLLLLGYTACGFRRRRRRTPSLRHPRAFAIPHVASGVQRSILRLPDDRLVSEGGGVVRSTPPSQVVAKPVRSNLSPQSQAITTVSGVHL